MILVKRTKKKERKKERNIYIYIFDGKHRKSGKL